MEIEYQLTEEDIIALTRYRLYKLPVRRNPITIRRFAYAVGFTFLAFGSWVILGNAVLPVTFLVLAIFSFLLYPRYFNWAIQRRVRATYADEKMQATLAPRTLIATSEGIEEQSSLGEIKVKWEAVENIEVMPTFTIMSIQKNSSIIIPKDQMIAGDYDSFVLACRQFCNKSAA